MSTFFLNMLFGHLFGDFVFQNKWMAVNKSASHFKCLVHCGIYTACVALFTGVYQPLWLVVVFLSHFIIDRLSLADKWLKLIRGRSLEDFVWNGHKGLPDFSAESAYIPNMVAAQKNYHMLRAAFAGVVYTVVDNTWHLAINYYSYVWLKNYLTF